LHTADLNLLIAFDALLAEGGVTAAAQRLNLSPSAMSRTLGRVREAFDDPILVRAGRGLVPTARALDLQAQVRDVLDQAEGVFRAAPSVDPARLERTFVIVANEGFVAEFGAALTAGISSQAPHTTLHFALKAEKTPRTLREQLGDLEIGVRNDSGPELRTQALFKDRFVGVVSPGHPLAQADHISAERFAAEQHVVVSRRGLKEGPIDLALSNLGLTRQIAAIAPSFPCAIAIAEGASMVASVPERQTASQRRSMFTFELPVPTPAVIVSMTWHPRSNSDAGHRWMRDQVRNVVAGRASPLLTKDKAGQAASALPYAR